MKYASWLFGLGVAALLGTAGRASADVNVNAPFVNVRVGGGVWVRAPFVNVYVPAGRQMVVPGQPYMPPAPGEARVVPEVVVPPGVNPPQVVLPDERRIPVVPPVLPARAPTLSEFAASFDARAGNYEVWIQHPVTCCPVKVCFSLPGCPRRVVVHKQEIAFRYGIGDVVRLDFCNDGTVKVRH
jgi:hypothetical protein